MVFAAPEHLQLTFIPYSFILSFVHSFAHSSILSLSFKMHAVLSAAIVVAATTIVVASPVEIRNKKSFTVHQQRQQNYTRVAPIVAVENTYAKFSQLTGATAPEVVVKAAQAARAVTTTSAAAAAATVTGSTVATPEWYDAAYYCAVTVGGQTLNLDFDTGSADLWVFSTQTPSSQSAGHPLYNATDGTSTLMSGSTFNIGYGDGSGASGIVYQDKVVIGSATATSQAVEAATSVSSSFTSDTNSDGLLGLAFSTINTVSPTQQTTFFDTVKSSLALPLFTADLQKQAAGSYDFGFIDTTKYHGSITYAAVNTRYGFWEFTAQGYAVGSNPAITTSIDAIVDTGTTLMYLPSAIVNAYYRQTRTAQNSNAYGGWVFPCSMTLPNFTIVIGGQKFVVPGSYMNYGPVYYNSNGQGTCFGGLQSSSGMGINILGDIFIKSQFIVFSHPSSGPQLGFAAKL